MKDNFNNEEVMIDVVSFTDEDGKEFEMELIDEFEYKNEKYVVLASLGEDDACGCEDGSCECECGSDEDEEDACECGLEDESCECGCEDDEDSLYIMKVVSGDDGEEFVPVGDDMFEEIIGYVEQRLYSEE